MCSYADGELVVLGELTGSDVRNMLPLSPSATAVGYVCFVECERGCLADAIHAAAAIDRVMRERLALRGMRLTAVLVGASALSMENRGQRCSSDDH